jgi:hypothetical protein
MSASEAETTYCQKRIDALCRRLRGKRGKGSRAFGSLKGDAPLPVCPPNQPRRQRGAPLPFNRASFLCNGAPSI